MDKEKLLVALNEIQNGEDAGYYHDEIETLIALVLNISDGEVKIAQGSIRIGIE